MKEFPKSYLEPSFKVSESTGQREGNSEVTKEGQGQRKGNAPEKTASVGVGGIMGH